MILRMLSTSALSAFSLSASAAGAGGGQVQWPITPVRGDTTDTPAIRLTGPQGSVLGANGGSAGSAASSSGTAGSTPSPGQILRRGSVIDLSV